MGRERHVRRGVVRWRRRACSEGEISAEPGIWPPVHARRCGWSLGISAETLRRWAGQAEVDSGVVAGVSASRSGSVKTSELEQTIEILKVATSFFARKCDPRHR